MTIAIGKKDIIWSYASQFLQFGAGLLLLPVILKQLSSPELAIWYIFLAMSTFANLLDFGFQPTIMRNVSYVFSGASKLLAKGIEEQELKGEVNYNLLYSLISTCKKIYKIVSSLILFLFGSAGTFYLFTVTKGQLDTKYVLVSWFLYIFSVSLNFYFYYYTPLLLGRGKIKESHMTIVFSKLIFIVLSYVFVLSGYGLIGISIANILGSIVNRFSSYYYFYDKEIKKHLKDASRQVVVPLFRILWYNSYRSGLVNIGAFFILKLNTFLVTYFLGLTVASQYGLTLQLAEMLMRVSVILFMTFLPLINRMRIEKNNKNILKIISKSYFISWGLYLFGFIFVLFLGNNLLDYIGSSTGLLSIQFLILLFLIIFLEMNHTIAATILTTKNEVPFVKASLISGLIIGISALVLLNYTDLGVYTVLISQGIVQLLYNNWKWPYEVCKEFKTNMPSLLKQGFIYSFRDLKEILYG